MRCTAINHIMVVLLICSIGVVSPHMGFDPFALKVIREKFEKKIDTNYFMLDKSMRQQPNAVQCSSEDGPYCPYINGKNINDNIEKNNTEYLRTRNSALGESIRLASAQVLAGMKRENSRGSDLLFYESQREILDELLYPSMFSRSTHFVFTFETFTLDKAEKKIDTTVTYDVEGSRFNTYLYPHLSNDLLVSVDISNMYLPSSSSPLLTYGMKTMKRFMNSFGMLSTDTDMEEIRFGRSIPQGTYSYTKDRQGTIKYSEDVFFQFIFARIHNVNSNVKNSTISGYYNDTQVFSIEVSIDKQMNGWKRYYLDNNPMINKIVIGHNLDVDNIHTYFSLSHYEKKMKGKKREELKVDGMMEPIVIDLNGKSIDGEIAKKIIETLRKQKAINNLDDGNADRRNEGKGRSR